MSTLNAVAKSTTIEHDMKVFGCATLCKKNDITSKVGLTKDATIELYTGKMKRGFRYQRDSNSSEELDLVEYSPFDPQELASLISSK
jgi:hypothetical protein